MGADGGGLRGAFRSPAEQRAYLNIGDEDASVGLPGVRVCRLRPTNYRPPVHRPPLDGQAPEHKMAGQRLMGQSSGLPLHALPAAAHPGAPVGI